MLGTGMARVLGARFLDRQGRELPPGGGVGHQRRGVLGIGRLGHGDGDQHRDQQLPRAHAVDSIRGPAAPLAAAVSCPKAL